MRLIELFEATSPSALHQLRGIVGNLVAFIEHDLKHLMQDSYSRLIDNDADKPLQKLKFVLNSRKARWFNENYFTSKATGTQGIRPALAEMARDPKLRAAHDDLRTLVHLPIQGHTPTRIAKEQTASKHFATLVQLLPRILDVVGRNVPEGERLQALGERVATAQRRHEMDLENITGPKEEPRAPKGPRVKQDELYRQQTAGVEDIVNQVIRERIPKKHQGEVRNRIAKAANKLAALKVELDRLGIKD